MARIVLGRRYFANNCGDAKPPLSKQLSCAYIHHMKHIAMSLVALSLCATPVAAEEDDGFSLMEQGARLFMKGLMDEMDPALRELEDMARDFEPFLQGFAEEMGPALNELMDQVEDWTMYHPPEILPNGDIIIRRRSADEMDKDDTQIDL